MMMVGSAVVLSDNTSAQLGHESRIVWTGDPADYEYVRVSSRESPRRAGPVEPPAGECVGYAELAPEAPNIGRPGVFCRRVFWLKDHDRHNDPQGVYEGSHPAEAIDPRTVRTGERGRRTERVSPIYGRVGGEGK